jgi:signal transduction histidine kinase
VAMLQKEIKRREDAEKTMKLALQRERELSELKTKFLSLVSHEFKTPLSGILTSATLVGKYKEAADQERRDKHLTTIIGEVRHLNSILTDFLSIERLEKGKEIYNFTKFSLSKVVNEVVYNANMLLKNGQQIKYPRNIDEVVIYQDEKIVTLILTNLLYNSIKYSPEDSEIDITFEVERDGMVLKIKDYGIGIPIKDQKHIFERYFRAENALLNQGTGIGLNIIKDHIKNLDGKISFESKENQGTIFTVELPIDNRIHLGLK